MKYGERLKQARKHAGITQAELASRIGNGVSQAGISYLEKSDATGSEFTAQFAKACGVSPIWLATEEGEMVTVEDKLYAALKDPKIRAAVELMQSMSTYQKSEVVDTSNTFTEQPAQGANGTK